MILITKCRSCGASMRFVPEKGKLACENCGTEQAVEERDEAARQAYEEESKVFRCTSCGSELITELNTTATFCSYCGQPTIIPERLSGTYAPTQVLPFKISQKQAEEAFFKWCRRGLVTPKAFVNAAKVRKISGIYVPFFLYDCDLSGDFQAEGTKIHMYRVGDTEYTETSFYAVHRNMDALYRRVPADASTKMDDQQMDKLEPFDGNELKPFMMPYLSGFFAEKYDVDGMQLMPRVRNRIDRYFEEYARSTMSGYASLRMNQRAINYDQVQSDYVLLPVWMLYYKHKDKEYLFTMNGQTGKVVGKPPISVPKVLLWLFGVSVAVFGLLKGLEVLLT